MSPIKKRRFREEAAFFCCAKGLACRPVFGHDRPRGSGSFLVHFKIRTQSSPKTKVAPHLKETPMRQFIRPVATALSIACLAASFALLAPGGALAQGKMAPAPAQAAPPPGGPPMQLKQIALTQKQIDGIVAAQKDMDAITSKLQPNARPDAKVLASLENVAKKNGFASYDDYNNVMDNISIVYGGIDPATKKYVGSEAVIKSQIAQVQSDKKMSANDKKQALEELNQALKQPEPPIQNKGNIDLVVQNFDKLSKVMGEDQQ
jgi:hypothetical protein